MKRNAITLIATTIFSIPSLCHSSELSYDFIQFSLSHTSFEDSSPSTRGFDLDLKKSMNENIFIYGSFGSGSVGTVFGGIEVPYLVVGTGIGVGYHRTVFNSVDIVGTIEMHQIDIKPETVPASLNAFNAGIGLRSSLHKFKEKTEGSLFASYTSVRDKTTYSLDLQLDYQLTKRLQISSGIDLMDFKSMTLGFRSSF